MPFDEQVTGTELRMTWSGDVDAETAHQPYESAVAAFDAHRLDRVVVDLAGMTFADSTALGSLVRINELAGERGGRLVLTRVPDRIRTLLNMTGLDQSLTVVDDA